MIDVDFLYLSRSPPLAFRDVPASGQHPGTRRARQIARSRAARPRTSTLPRRHPRPRAASAPRRVVRTSATSLPPRAMVGTVRAPPRAAVVAVLTRLAAHIAPTAPSPTHRARANGARQLDAVHPGCLLLARQGHATALRIRAICTISCTPAEIAPPRPLYAAHRRPDTAKRTQDTQGRATAVPSPLRPVRVCAHFFVILVHETEIAPSCALCSAHRRADAAKRTSDTQGPCAAIPRATRDV